MNSIFKFKSNHEKNCTSSLWNYKFETFTKARLKCNNCCNLTNNKELPVHKYSKLNFSSRNQMKLNISH